MGLSQIQSNVLVSGMSRWFIVAAIATVFLSESVLAQSAQSLGIGLRGWPHAIVEYQGDMVVGGRDRRISGTQAGRVSRWDGRVWHAMGKGMDGWVFALVEYRGDLIAAGRLSTADGKTVNNIARWDGSEWQPMGKGFGGREERTVVKALVVYDGELIAGGWFSTADGRPIENIARWDGSSWQPFGSGANSTVRTFLLHDGMLVAGGDFRRIDGVPANRIAAWDGRQWQTFDDGVNMHLNALASYRGDIVAAGMFTRAGDQPADRIARWDGSRWNVMGQGMFGVTERRTRGNIFDVTVIDDMLFAGGYFRTNADPDVAFLTVWDGYEWREVGDGVNNAVNVLANRDGKLVAGGRFRMAGALRVNYLAEWDVAGLLPTIADVSRIEKGGGSAAPGRSVDASTMPTQREGLNRSSIALLSMRKGRISAHNGRTEDVDSKNLKDEPRPDQPLDDRHAQPPRFAAIPIAGPNPYIYVWLTGLNDRREAVGFAAPEAPMADTSRALYWNGFTDAVELAGLDSKWIDMTATSINDDGLVVGWTRSEGDETQAFLWDHANRTILLPELAYAVDVDVRGRVLGVTESGAAAIWNGDSLRVLPQLPGDHPFHPLAMNDHGHIVGNGWSINDQRRHAFLFMDGKYVDLGLALDDDSESEAAVISNSGLILGSASRTVNDKTMSRAIIWQINDDGVSIAHIIDPLPGDSLISGIDLNEAGEVVGVSGNPGRPFLWIAGDLYDLSDLVEEDNVTFSIATSINNRRWITVDGRTDCCGYVLRPIGEGAVGLSSDRAISVDDLLSLLDAWGECPPDNDCPADLNKDGVVDLLDLLELLSNGE